MKIPKHITKEFLRENSNVVFVFGDNDLRYGKGGAAVLRDEPNTYGFVTKKEPNNKDSSFYRPEEYWPVFIREMNGLHREILSRPDKIFLLSRIGSGLANRYGIYEKVIVPGLEVLRSLKNVVFL